MDFAQTYETTITEATARQSATVLVIPARSLGSTWGVDPGTLDEVAGNIFGGFLEPQGIPDLTAALVNVLSVPSDLESHGERRPQHLTETLAFANHIATAQVIPFEHSPLGAESLATIAKAGAVPLGAWVGYLSISGGPPAFLLITVPLGIVLVGASVSFNKWIQENRKSIWNSILAWFTRRSEEPRSRFERSRDPRSRFEG
jgi:hypothetical protein